MATDPPAPTLRRIFLVFLSMGATGFGTSLLPYYRTRLVESLKWISEEDFLATLKIAQLLPGLNATNMSVIMGDRLRGPKGAFVATIGLLLPGAIALCVLGTAYAAYRHDPNLDAALDGVASAAAGILMALSWKLGRPQFLSWQVVILAAATIAISYFKLSLVLVLLALAPLSIWLCRPRSTS